MPEEDKKQRATSPALPALSLDGNPKAVIAFIVDEVNQERFSVYEKFMTPHFVSHDPARHDITGRDAYIEFMWHHRHAFPDLQTTIEDILVDRNRIAFRWSATGVHERAYFGAEPSGQRVQWSGTNILRVEQGKMVEEWIQSDALGLHRQLGSISQAFTSIT